MASALVIGYGNDLRTDDGAGRWVADRVEELNLADVEVKSISQLTPEIALDISERRLVVFVDANVSVADVEVSNVQPAADGPTLMTHHGDPAAIVGLARRFGQEPESSVLVSIPVFETGMGQELTPECAVFAQRALVLIPTLLGKT